MFATKRTVVIATGAALTALSATGVLVGAAPAASASSKHSFTDFAFDVNNNTTDPGFVQLPGSSSATFGQGDESIVNDQVTTSHKVKNGYPIIGYDSGTCTFTRVKDKNAKGTYSNCVVTAVLPRGSVMAQGVIRYPSQQPASATFAVTGGTGEYDGASGTVRVSFTKNYKILNFDLLVRQ